MIKILKLCNFSLEDLEKNVAVIRTGRKTSINGSVGRGVYNPKLPVYMTSTLARVVSRFMGDGCIKMKWCYDASYVNTSSILLEQMEKDILRTFGKCYISEIIDPRGKGIKTVRFPSIVGLIIVSIFGDVSTSNARISDLILKGNDKIKSAFLQAYFDDEGTVSKQQPMVRYYTINSKTAGGIKRLLNNLDIKCTISKVKYITKKNKKSGAIYHITITSHENVSKFLKVVSPCHPEKRKSIVKCLSVHNPRSNTKTKMLELLESKNHWTSRELSSYLNLSIYTIRWHLYDLEKQKKALRKEKINNSFIWSKGGFG